MRYGRIVHGALIPALLCMACARPKPPMVNQTPAMPDLSSRGVLVLPVHAGPVPGAIMTAPGDVRLDGVSELDAELAYWLRERAPTVRWVLPETIDRMLARTPALGIQLRALEINAFRRAHVERIGDPLFGDLKRLAAVFDVRLALIPVSAEFKPAASRIESAIVLIDTTFGEVAWFGVLDGESPAELAQRIATLFAPRTKPTR